MTSQDLGGSNAGGFSFELCGRNSILEKRGLQAPGFLKTGTTIAGVIYKARDEAERMGRGLGAVEGCRHCHHPAWLCSLLALSCASQPAAPVQGAAWLPAENPVVTSRALVPLVWKDHRLQCRAVLAASACTSRA